MKKFIALMCSAVLCFGVLAGCGSDRESKGVDIDVNLTERARYDNRFGEENIPDQWTDYGVGDPFVMRWNGEYYLYVSTKNFENGYRVWKSRDLIHYEYLGQHKLTGKDGSDKAHHTAYAPEVYYWNGDFYMYCSPDGKGHYIYKSVDGTPYGDFQAVTDNLQLSIDGSVFIDDDESMYFYSASDGGINSYKMDSMTSIDDTTQRQLYAPLVKWTEGPFVLKRDGVYYLTYTGNHVKSTGYRVDYSYATDSPVSKSYRYPSNNSLLLSTLTEQNGLGHSSTVLGPDLDSYYIAYHNLQSASGPIRQFNLNRLEFSGTRMNVLGPTDKGAQTPNMPDFYVTGDGTSYGESRTDALTEDGTRLLSNAAAAPSFSAEYNFKNIATDGSFKLMFGVSGEDYAYVTVNGKKIQLRTSKGATVAEGALKNDFDFTKLHSVRIAYTEGRVTVAFDNMTKIDTALSGVKAGKIGYDGIGGAEPGTTVFSNHSFGSSDRAEAKPAGGDFFASNCLDGDGATRLGAGSGAYKLDADPEDDRRIYSEATSFKLANAGDYATYAVDVLKDGLYGFESLYANASAGSVIHIQIDDGAPMRITLPGVDYSENYNEYETNLKYAKHLLAEFTLTKGLHTLTVEVVKGTMDAISYGLFESSKQSPSYSNDLSGIVDKGAEYFTLWKIKDGAHYSKSGVNNLVMFGSDTMTDYTVSVKVRVDVDSSTASSAGIIMRMNNPSIMSGQVDECAEGYMITFNNMQLVMKRINYNAISVATEPMDIERGVYHEIKAAAKGNKISVWFDGNYMFSYTDPYPFHHGAIGLYSVGTEAYYKDLVVTSA